jgi:starch synthase
VVPGLKVLFLSAEATPLAKVGGLADVAGELPAALRALGIDVLLVTPLHPSSDATDVRIHRSVEFEVASVRGAVGSEGHLGEVRGQAVLLVDGAPVRAMSGVYGNAETNGEKFGFFSRAGLEACRALGWRPDVVHANDWHTAPAVYWLSAHRPGDGFWRDAATVLTIHNLGFMGVGSESSVLGYGLMPAEDPRLPDWARSLPLPLGLLTADWITTVSPSYAQEIQTADLGYGLEGLLKARADRLEGILNGIDPTLWNPATDPSLTARFSRETLEARKANQRALRDELGLPYDPGGALCAMVTRLDTQKGVDLALEALALLEDEPWQFVLLGTGDPDLEQEAQGFVRVHPTRARAILRFDPALSRRVYAGADILLVPSRYEPCGLSQMIAMRYGCIPVVRATGGLRDTVRDDEAGDGNGFVFEAASPDGLAGAMRRAMRALADRSRWRALQSRAMRADHSWRRSAEKYADLYRRAARPR